MKNWYVKDSSKHNSCETFSLSTNILYSDKKYKKLNIVIIYYLQTNLI